MIVLEFSEDKFGKAMKAVSCICKKAEYIKEMFEEDAMGYRGKKKYEEDDDDYEDYGRKHESRYSTRMRY